MGEELHFENGRLSKLPRSHDLDLDLGSGHTAYRRASLIDLYLHVEFQANRVNFLLTYVT